jgi:hypothetical protein
MPRTAWKNMARKWMKQLANDRAAPVFCKHLHTSNLDRLRPALNPLILRETPHSTASRDGIPIALLQEYCCASPPRLFK